MSKAPKQVSEFLSKKNIAVAGGLSGFSPTPVRRGLAIIFSFP
jgi:hypothetical protein